MTESFQGQTLTTDIQPSAIPSGFNPLINPIPSSPLSGSSLPIATVSPPVLAVSGNTNYTGTTPQTVAPNLTISGTDNFNGARVFIDQNFNTSKDRLSVSNSVANSGSLSGIDWSYNPQTGVLTLNNSAGNNNVAPSTYQDVLRQVTYANSDSSDPGNARSIQFALGNLLANPDNGHFYQFVNSNGIAWTDAKTAADGLNYFGLKGYLATITSATEQQFIDARVQGNGWIGASDSPSQGASRVGDWKWVTGPEAGQSFWNGDVGGSTVDSRYTNWEVGEPNNAGGVEFYGHVLGNPDARNSAGNPVTLGKWNDLANTRPNDEYAPRGYLVEYGGLKDDPTLNITGSVTVSLSASNRNTTQSPLTTPDFSKDGRPDILWRNQGGVGNGGNGQNGIWVLDYDNTSADTGFTLNPRSKLITQEGDSLWRVEGLYDINKDGITDIFWRNYRTGDNGIWLMKDDAIGIDIGTGSALLPIERDPNWVIEGVGDFDNDGTANILWRNYRTGDNGIWQVDYNPNASASGNPFTYNTDKSKLLAREVDIDWQVKGWADFTGDKTLDILWRNIRTGENSIWKLNNNATGANPYYNLGDSYLINTVPITSGWEIEDAIDFNKDGIADIVWRNYTTGENGIWAMTSGGLLDPAKTALIASATPSAEWEIDGAADFTGDQIPDILWRNYDTDENKIWRMKIDNNIVALDKEFLLPKAGDLNWEIVGPRARNDRSNDS